MKGIALFALLLVPLAACAGRGPEMLATDGGARDAGSVDAGDSGVGGGPIDASSGSDGATMPPAATEYDSAARAGAVDACFDGADNDENAASDCADTSCQSGYSSCCVGASSTVCCDAVTERAFPMDACTGSLDLCGSLGTFLLFGYPPPSVDVALGESVPSFVSRGDTDHSGVMFADVLDPRLGEIRLEAEVATSNDAPTGGQIDALALGLVDASTDVTMLSNVTPFVAFQVSRNRHELALVLSGDVVQRWSIDDPEFHTYTLTLQPDGAVRLIRDLVETAPLFDRAGVLPLSGPLRAVAYGRTDNPTGSESPPVRARALTVTTRTCDMPRALDRSADPAVPAPLADTSWADALTAIQDPHVLRWVDGGGATQVRMALVIDGEIHLAQPGAGGFQLVSTLGDPALAVTASWASDGLADPVLRYDESVPVPRLELWFTGYSGGRGTIARAIWDEGSAHFVLDDTVLGDDGSGTSYEHPALFEWGGILFLAATVRQASDPRETQIDLFSVGGSTATRTETVRRPSHDDLFAFDRDEVADPAVIVVDGVPRMYFAGRRGTRWTIGVTVFHPEVSTWTSPAEAQILGGDAEGFDALGVRDPAPFLIEATDGTRELRLYFSGTDGMRTRVGVASGALPPLGT